MRRYHRPAVEPAPRCFKGGPGTIKLNAVTKNRSSGATNALTVAQVLSDKRAQAVRDHLVQQEGVPAARLTAKGHGKAQPVADNATDAGRARNRRVDIVISARS